ncbi:uracil-DNA glycosylase family protein [Clostridium estertheticum]|uniref:Uracil-DNA glycosylase-like domain-containing protein n=1 Tax=Clostridium estertheticum TaxID=238834 RepID=A0A7Y3SZV9_9CLOT|nr:hypothetical protein [Clostridium estertheticum]NNU78115.1 hypothetical protein [Clostridium estertheticum]WBL47773.1 hypothetical protein LOR37_03520 [Clostridium estertheticum]
MSSVNLKESIAEIGNKMIHCNNDCEGASCDLSNGILPRGLILEERPGAKGCIIVGINPGSPTKKDDFERENYKKDPSYSKQLEVWDTVKDYKYHTKLRNFLNELGFDGDMLWTELVKCENSIRRHLPTHTTFRNCMGEYLNKELKLFDTSYPIIAVGKMPFTALKYSFLDRTIIGIPHPTGSYGYFDNLSKTPILNKKICDELLDGEAIWLYDLVIPKDVKL